MKLVYNENKLASNFNNSSISVASNLELNNPPTKKANKNLNDPLKKVSSHPRVQKMQDRFRANNSFIFTSITSDEVRKEILNLEAGKATIHGGIAADILKGNIEVH